MPLEPQARQPLLPEPDSPTSPLSSPVEVWRLATPGGRVFSCTISTVPTGFAVFCGVPTQEATFVHACPTVTGAREVAQQWKAAMLSAGLADVSTPDI
jgi:hypothetical protein